MAAMATSLFNSEASVAHFRSEIENEQFFKLKSVFLASGKGRRPNLPSVEFNNELLVQLLLLKEEGGKSFDDTASFLHQLIPENDSVPLSRLRYILVNAEKSALKLTDVLQKKAFVSEAVELENLGPYLHGIRRQQLLDGLHFTPYRSSTYGLLKDLINLRKKERKTTRDLCQWWLQLTGTSLEEAKVKKAIDACLKTNAKLQPSAHREKGGEIYRHFLSSCPFGNGNGTSAAVAITTPSSSTSLTPGVPAADCHGKKAPDALLLKLAQGATQLAAARRNEEEQVNEIDGLKLKLETVIEASRNVSREFHALEEEKDGLEKVVAEKSASVKELTTKNTTLTARNNELKAQVSALKQDNITRRLKRLNKKFEDLQFQHRNMKFKTQCLSQSNTNLTRKIRRMKKAAEDAGRQTRAIQKQLVQLRRRNAELEQQSNERKEIRLKDPHTGFFTQDAKVLLMELSGQHEIPAARCGGVIKSVCQHLLHAVVPPTDLPSDRSVGRFSDVGQVLAKMHVTEALLNSDTFDLHTDGTTKYGQKYVGHQVTLDSGQSLTCGFSVVGSENTSTLVDVAVRMLEELALIFEDSADKRHEVFLDLLKGLSGLMSDRAAVMKSFGSSLSNQRKILLQTDEDLQFLFCNAHFLLGLSSAVDKAFKSVQNQVEVIIGRDSDPKFAGKNRGEHPVNRYIREACACLGPRGDDKFGCRENWLAFCLLIGKQSQITSFKSNRFNNLFEVSGALHVHRLDISNFFCNYMQGLNWKQDGIRLDVDCDDLDDHIIALGLVYHRLTGPYWQLLGRDVRYLDFYAHVVCMQGFLERWSENPGDAFTLDFEPLFGIDMKCAASPVFLSFLSITEERKAHVLLILKALATAFLDVVSNQLKDFLPGGKYHAVQEPELRQRLQNSKLTNLIGEQCFGDLDFSMFKRRNASTHLHTTINLLKRNKTITDWFLLQAEDRQKQLLSTATPKASSLRKKHQQEERQAAEARRQALLDNHQKKMSTERKRQERKEKLIATLRPHNGPCLTAADLTQLLRFYHKNADRVKALKAEVMFRKSVLGQVSPLLKASAKLPELISNLHHFLGGEQEEDYAALLDDLARRDQHPPKRRRLFSDSESGSESTDNTSLCESDDVTPDHSEPDLDKDTIPTFSFSDIRPGMRVLVGYEDDCYVGEVDDVTSDQFGNVNFMQKCIIKRNTYKWPERPDRAEVHAKFVLASNFEMETTNGRIWTLSNAAALQKLYATYKQAYF